MKLIAIALLLPTICLAKTESTADILGQLLAMKSSGTHTKASAEYTYDDSKAPVVSILELVQEIMGDNKAAATKRVEDISSAETKLNEEAAKAKTAKTAKATAENSLKDAANDLTDAEGEQGKAQARVETLTKEKVVAEEASKKSKDSLCGIVTFLCQNTTDKTQDACKELTGMCTGQTAGSVTTTTSAPCDFAKRTSFESEAGPSHWGYMKCPQVTNLRAAVGFWVSQANQNPTSEAFGGAAKDSYYFSPSPIVFGSETIEGCPTAFGSGFKSYFTWDSKNKQCRRFDSNGSKRLYDVVLKSGEGRFTTGYINNVD